MKDNCYAYAIDLSLRKGKNGEYSEPLIFEYQPLLSSNLRGRSSWSYENALVKAFPNSNITINSQGNRFNIHTKNPVRHILIKNSEELSQKDFNNILKNKYTHIHTGSFETEIDHLNNKVHQRLYLPDEVSPEYRILESKVESEKLAKDISNYFGNKKISKIVLKSAISHEGQGNFFIDITDQAALNQGIKKIQKLNNHSKYFLAEEQKEFSHISRKTGESKSGHLTYRLVGIANKDGDVGHFIASKSISSSLDSHQQQQMKCYFGESNKTFLDSKDGNWLLKSLGPKDKYFGIGDNKIDIDPALMDKISKNMYQLYADIKSMNEKEFAEHVDRLIELKTSLPSKEARIENFKTPLQDRKEIVNKNDNEAFSRACESDYNFLAEHIAKEMIAAKTVNLKQLSEYPNYRQDDQLKIMLSVMEEKKYVKGLLTANKGQLKYCLDTKVAPTISTIFIKALKDKKNKLTENFVESKLQSPTTQVINLVNQTEVNVSENKALLEKETQPQVNTNSYFTSRLQQAFFNEPSSSSAESEVAMKPTTSKVNHSVSRLAGLPLFTNLSDDESKKVDEKQIKSSSAAKKH